MSPLIVRRPVSGGGIQGSFTTTFPATENPISQGATWVNGLATGLDWHNVQTAGGVKAFGTQNSSPNFTDSIAHLTGSWGNDQTATAVATTTNQQAGTSIFEEMEILLRFSITSHHATGYEFTYAARPASDLNRYVQINRWNGALGGFTTLNALTGPGINTGDVCKAVITGNPWPVLNILVAPAATPTVFTSVFTYDTFTGGDGTLNGSPDSIVWSSGAPGVGFYNQGGTATLDTDYGWTSFSVTTI